MLLQTARIFLREFTYDDFDSLFEILSDAEVMKYYPKPFDAERVKGWIEWNLQNYKQYGFGLWAVCLKDSGKMIGDCGITIQNIDGELLPEIGYHIHKDFWRQGFATEAATAVRDWAFENTKYDCLYSYMKYSNVPSCKPSQIIGLFYFHGLFLPSQPFSSQYFLSASPEPKFAFCIIRISINIAFVFIPTFTFFLLKTFFAIFEVSFSIFCFIFSLTPFQFIACTLIP